DQRPSQQFLLASSPLTVSDWIDQLTSRLPTSFACSITTASRNNPRITDCQYADRDIQPSPFSKLSALKRMPRSSTPASVVPTEPMPPVSSVPPTTTAAMANSSQPTPSMGWPAPN